MTTSTAQIVHSHTYWGNIWTKTRKDMNKKNNIKFFFIISCGLQPRVTYNSAYIFFFSLLKALDNAQSFLGYVLLKVFTFYLFTLQHHVCRCALHHRRDYDEQRTVVVVWASLAELPIKRERRYTRKYLRGLDNLYPSTAHNQGRLALNCLHHFAALTTESGLQLRAVNNRMNTITLIC